MIPGDAEELLFPVRSHLLKYLNFKGSKNKTKIISLQIFAYRLKISL